MLQKPLRISAAVLGIAAFCSAIGAGSHTPPEADRDSGLVPADAYFFSLYQAMNYDCGVYRGTVRDIECQAPFDGMMARGHVELDVTETLDGEPLKQISLPFYRASRHIFDDYFPTWPDEALLPRADVCVVVLPHAYYRSAGVQRGLDKAASFVFIVSNACDAPANDTSHRLDWLKRVIALQKIVNKNAEQAKSALADALGDESPKVRGYAVDALIDNFVDDDPRGVIDRILAAPVRTLQAHPDLQSESYRTLATIAKLGDARTSLHPRLVTYAALDALAGAILVIDDKTVRKELVRKLANNVAVRSYKSPDGSMARNPGVPVPPPPSAKAVLDSRRVEKLQQVLAQLRQSDDSDEAIRVVQDWLNGK